MSASELDRFSADLKSDGALRDQFAEKSNDLGAIVESAQASGYGFTLEDVQERIARQGVELSEVELETVAGGRARAGTIFISDDRGGAFIHW